MFESLIWLVPVVIVLASLRWPRAGLLIFAAALPFFGAPPGGPYLAALDVSALAAIATGLRAGARSTAGAGAGRCSSLDVGVLAVFVVTVAAFFPLAYRPPSWSPGTLVILLKFLPDVERWTILYTWRALANMALGVGLYLAVKRAFPGRLIATLGRALGVGLLSSLSIGFLEFLGWLDLWSFRPIGLPVFDDRFHSVFFHSGWMAEFVVLATPLAAVAWTQWESRWRMVGYAIVLMALVAVLFSGQRGAWFSALSQLIVAAVVFWRGRWSGKQFARVSLAAIAALVISVGGIVLARPDVAGSLTERLGESVSNLSNRTSVWHAAMDMAMERPLLGWGGGTFSPVLDLETFGESSPQKFSRKVLGHNHQWLTAHNTYLMFLAERGGLGLASLFFLGWSVVVTVWRHSRGPDVHKGGLAFALLICTTGFAIYGLVQYLFFPRAIAFLLWMLVGAVAALGAGFPQVRGTRLGWILIITALVLLPFRAFGWDGPPSRGSRSVGFHAPEPGNGAPYQWTATRHALRQITWEDEVLVLKVANGNPRASAEPVAVEILVDGAIVKQVQLGEGWHQLRIDLGPPTKETVVLGLKVDRTFRPYSEYLEHEELERSRDLRRLGIAVRDIGWEPSPVVKMIGSR